MLTVSSLQAGNEDAGHILMVLVGYVRGLEQRYPILFQNAGLPKDYQV